MTEFGAAAKAMGMSFHTVKLPVDTGCASVHVIAHRCLDLQAALHESCKQSPTDTLEDVEAPRSA